MAWVDILKSDNHTYDNAGSNLLATNVKTALDELDDKPSGGGSNLPVSQLITGTMSVDNTTIKNVQAQVPWTGTGASNPIVSNIESRDMNWDGVARDTGQLAFIRSEFKMYESTVDGNTTDPTAGGGSNWIEVADNVVKSHPNSDIWIKSRSTTDWNGVLDTLRGRQILHTNNTNAEASGTSVLVSFNVDGFTVGTSATSNALGETYIAWQRAYNKVFINTTNQGERELIAFDDVSNRQMTLYQGSTVVDHELSNAIGKEFEKSVIKNLDTAQHWIATAKGVKDDYYLYLDEDIAETSWSGVQKHEGDVVRLPTGDDHNNSAQTFIMYAEASSDNIKQGVYSGTGVAGNFIPCGFKPARVEIKNKDSVADWNVVDNIRGEINTLSPNLSSAEASNTGTINIENEGFTINLNLGGWNTRGATYTFTAYADTNYNGGGSTAPIPSLTSNVNLTAGSILGYSDGADSSGAKNTAEDISGTITGVIYQQGMNWLKKVEGGGWSQTLNKPVVGRVTIEATDGQADYHTDGSWKNYLGTQYSPPIAYLPHPTEVDVGSNLAEVNTEDSTANVRINKLSCKEIVGLDKPIFDGVLNVMMETPDVIFPWVTVIDTHNAMSGGIWTCPKTGVYTIEDKELHNHREAGVIDMCKSSMFVNNIVGSSCVSTSDNSSQYIVAMENRTLYMTKGELVYVKLILGNVNHRVNQSSGQRFTTLSIRYLGKEFTN